MIRRRSFFAHLLAAGTMPGIAGMARAAPAGISARLVGLIAEFQRCTRIADSIDFDTHPAEWEAAANTQCLALDALLGHPPATMAEFATKFEALVPATSEDADLVILNALVDDARALAE
jgi:hypothetical protein